MMSAAELRAALLAAGHVRGGGTLRVRVNGWSMAPLLHPGDEIIVVPLGPGGPRPGDVLVIVDGRGLLTHRAAAVSGRAIRTRGDNCAADDPPTQTEAVVGRVVGRARAGAERSLDTPRWQLVGRAVVGAGRAPRIGRLAARVVCALSLAL